MLHSKSILCCLVAVEVHFTLKFGFMFIVPDNPNIKYCMKTDILHFESLQKNVGPEKHSTYQCNMESGHSLSELEDVHLVLRVCNGNITNAVRIYKEKYPNHKVSNHSPFPLLTAYFK
jgi:hypothetical protein